MQKRIEKGSIWLYRVFDVADEIDLPIVEGILREYQGKGRLTLTRIVRQALVMRDPPVRVSLGEIDLTLPEGVPTRAEGYATIWDYGVISILFQLPIPAGTPWARLVEVADLLNRNETGAKIDEVARKKAADLSQIIKGALTNPAERTLFEDYVIYFLEQVEGLNREVEDLASGLDSASLILAESKEILSKKYRDMVLSNTHQYAQNDLVVIDWNSAVVVEPSGSREIPDILEFALTHLLEFRYYDDVIDTRLRDLYDAIEKGRAGLFRSRYSAIARDAKVHFIEISEFLERVDNSLKVVGDFYLAVIFRSAIKQFRIPDWQQSVTRKLNLIARVSELLQDEVNVVRSHMLEFIIILLIAIDIIKAMVVE